MKTNREETKMNIHIVRSWVAICCAVLLATSSAFAEDLLTIEAPLELQVTQRTIQNKASVTISGVAKGNATVVQAKADLATGTTSGKAVPWTTIAKGAQIAGGKFTGKLSLKAGGWYVISIRTGRNRKVIAQSKIMKVGVGDVFITAGQSNSANHGRPRQEAKDDRVVYYNGKSFVPAKDPIPGGAGNGGSVWSILGDHIVKSQQVPVCFRSTTLCASGVGTWMPGARPPNNWVKVPLYDNLLKCVAAFGKDGVRAVLWHQGESDSVGRTPAETYCERLKTVVDALNKDAGYVIPWFVAQASYHPRGSTAESQKAVARGQRLIWAKGIAHKGPNTDEIIGAKYRGRGVHFNQLGLTEHGARWFKALSAEYKW